MNSKTFLLSLAAAVVLTGCAVKHGSETTVTGPDGTKTTYTNDGKNTTVTAPDGSKTSVKTDPNGSVTYESKDGTATVGGTITEQDLGVAFYPGSKEVTNGAMKSEANGRKTIMSTRTTGDAAEKVIAFYEGRIKDFKFAKIESDGSVSASGTGKIGNGMSTVITVVREKGKSETQISIVSGTDTSASPQ